MSNDVFAVRARWTVASVIKLLAEAHREGWSSTPMAEPAPEDLETTRESLCWSSPEAPDELLRVRLGLTPVQHDALWLLACIESDVGIARLVRALGTAEAPDLTIPLWRRLVACAGSGKLASADIAVLADRALVELDADTRVPQHRRRVRANDRFIEIAQGELDLDRELAAACELVMPDDSDASYASVPSTIVAALSAPEPAIVVAQGPEGSGRTTVLARAAAHAGFGTLRIRADRLPRDPERLARQARAIARECDLFDVLPLIAGIEALGDDMATVFERELVRRSTRTILVTIADERRWTGGRAVAVHRMEALSIADRVAVWRDALPGAEAQMLDELAARYRATPGTIIAAARVARARHVNACRIEDAHEGLRVALDERLAGLASRVNCTQTWDDVVLPSDQLEQVVELVARVRHRRQVLEEWGFAAKVSRGLGVATLFSGPPGTGKTMVAGLIGRELGLDLYQVDLSRVVSKYIGETEKNLARLFDAAESGHSILLFDEADALFAKRSDVKSSNDRYANLEVNFLLQRIEQFSGISILTTNHERSIDEAFRRRLAIHVRFPMPDEDQRALLWRAMIPPVAIGASSIDYRMLAGNFVMTGGYIKNAALRAAYRAAADSSVITMDHLWNAARSEYDAMGKLAVDGI